MRRCVLISLSVVDVAIALLAVALAGTTAYQFAWGAPWDFLALAVVRLLFFLGAWPCNREFVRWNKVCTLGIISVSTSYAVVILVVRLLTWTPPVTRANSAATLLALAICVFMSFCLKKVENKVQISEERLLEGLVEDPSKKVGLVFFVSLLRQEWVFLLTAVFFLFFAAICQVLIPHYISMTITLIAKATVYHELALKPISFDDLSHSLFMLIAVGTVGSVCASCRGCTFIIMGSRVSKHLRVQLFKSILQQELGFFDVTKSGELSSRLTQDCQKVSDQVTLNANVFFRALIQVVTTLAFMFYLNRKLTALAFLSVPVVALVSRKFGKYMKEISKKTQDALAEANAQAEEAITSMSTVKAFAAENEEVSRVDGKLLEYMKFMRRYARNYLVYLSTVQFLPNAMTCLILAYGGKLAIQEHEVDGQVLMAFVFYLQTLNDSFSTMGDMYTNVMQAFGSASRVFELIVREPADTRLHVTHSSRARLEMKNVCDLVFEDVVFHYPAREALRVLDGLSLRLKGGAVSALVGPSGGGKSTVMALLQNWYAPMRGKVLLGTTPVWELDHTWHKKIMSIVAQEPCLFGRTIRENILYGTAGGDVEEAARLAAAHDFISALPDGYNTNVGEKGVQLSGGQKQRIAIARALVRQPKILLLDEATSALDTQSERVVQDALDQLISARSGLTVVVIAHRLTTIRKADCIYVIDGGKLAEHGCHHTLMKHDGVYRSLVKLQVGPMEAGEK